jgi:hypothetical protein
MKFAYEGCRRCKNLYSRHDDPVIDERPCGEIVKQTTQQILFASPADLKDLIN